MRFRSLSPLAVLAMLLAGLPWARADKFTYREENGTERTIEGRLIGSAEDWHLVELADGRYEPLSVSQVLRREESPVPEPDSADAVLAALGRRFGADRFRGQIQAPYVMGLVLQAPLPKGAETRSTNFLRQMSSFLKNVDSAFGRFIRDARLPASTPSHPLVVLVFEGNDDFVRYVQETTSGMGRSANTLGGFYSPQSNYLVVRMEECRTFDTVLHEAIHQQCYNRAFFQRMAAIPTWFAEGIACAFESNQGKISVGPGKISPRYTTMALQSRQFNWEQLATTDGLYSQDSTAGEAYGMGWGLHWVLVTKYKIEYAKYLRILAAKQPLAKDSPEQRLADFQQAFGRSPGDIGAEFRPTLDAALKRQKITLDKPPVAGYSHSFEEMAEVQISAVRHLDPRPESGRLEVKGSLTNLSPLRALAFHVTLETDAGTYAEWFVPSVEMQKSVPLPAQSALKVMAMPPEDAARVSRLSSLAATGRRFRVHVHSTPADGKQAELWRSGKLPVPAVPGYQPEPTPAAEKR